jgi:diaminopimelate epimerase
MRTNFIKSQALGNDFIIIEDIERRFDFKPSTVAKLCDRHFGIGADGLMVVWPSNHADFFMLFFNPDGSQAEMCGNGIRCFAAYLYNHGLTSKHIIKIETKGGLREVFLLFKDGKLEATKVNMGRPIFKTSDIPMNVDEYEFVDDTLEVNGDKVRATCLSVGNPHCVIFVKDTSKAPVRELGPKIEKLSIFPNRINVEFTQVIRPDEIRLRVWERGAGETLACGTGACAAVLAGVRNKLTSRKVRVHLPGGNLDIEWADDEFIYMTGSSEEVFRGEANIEKFLN